MSFTATGDDNRATKRQPSPEDLSSSTASIHPTNTSPSTTPSPPSTSTKSTDAQVLRSLLSPFKRMRDTLTRRVKQYKSAVNTDDLDDGDRALIQEVREALSGDASMGYEADRECISRSPSFYSHPMAFPSITKRVELSAADLANSEDFSVPAPFHSRYPVPARVHHPAPVPAPAYFGSNTAVNNMFSYFTDRARADEIAAVIARASATERPSANPMINDPSFDSVSPVPLRHSVTTYPTSEIISSEQAPDSSATQSRKRSHPSSNSNSNSNSTDSHTVSEDSDSDPEPPSRPRKYRRMTVDGKICIREGAARPFPPRAPTWDGGYKADVSDSDEEREMKVKEVKTKEKKTVGKAKARLLARIKANKGKKWILSTPSARGARRSARLAELKGKLRLSFPTKGEASSSSDAFAFTSPKCPTPDPAKPSSTSPSAKPKSTKLTKFKAELKSKIKLSKLAPSITPSISFASAVKQHKLNKKSKFKSHPQFITHPSPLARPTTPKFKPHPHFVTHPAPLVRPTTKKFKPHPTFVMHPAPMKRPVVVDVFAKTDARARTRAGKRTRDAKEGGEEDKEEGGRERKVLKSC